MGWISHPGQCWGKVQGDWGTLFWVDWSWPPAVISTLMQNHKQVAQGGWDKSNVNGVKEKRWENLTHLLWHLPLHKCSGSDSHQHGYFPCRATLVAFYSSKSEQQRTGKQSWAAEKCPGREPAKSRFILSSRTKPVVEPAPSFVKQASVLRKLGAGHQQ